MWKMRLRYILLGIIALFAAIGLIYVSYGRIAVYMFAKANDLDISYSSLKTSGTNMAFKDFKVKHRSLDMGILAGSAVIRPSARGSDFDLTDVRFLKEGADNSASYENLNGLVAIPFEGNWIYKKVSGTVLITGQGVEVKKLDAVSDEIKLRVNGKFNKDNTVDADMTISFGEGIKKKVPAELSNIILTEQGDGWKSLSVRMTGNYAQPSIQISSKLFRLNIKSITEK